MPDSRRKPPAPPESLDDLFREADKLWDAGRNREARLVFRKLAETGDASAQLNLGYMLAAGQGGRKNWQEARRWYLRSYAGGHSSAAINMGHHYRILGKRRSALQWFARAAKLGDDSGLLQIAKYLIGSPKTLDRARKLLKKVVQSAKVTEGDREEAGEFLRELL